MNGSRKEWRKSIAAMMALSMLLLPASPAWAWGRLGHRVISRIAEKQLNAKAKAAVAALLEEGESIADASTWADEHRRELPKTAPWHYVDVPLGEPRYDSRFSGDRADKGCIVDKIAELRQVVRDERKPLEERRFALRFLIHLVEDLHMPLHVGDNGDKGGNRTQLRFFEKGTNMHRLWDSDMIERVSGSEEFWLGELAGMDTPERREAAAKGTVEDWATESLRAAQAAYLVPQTGAMLKPGQKLSDAYLKANLPVARERLYLAGVRVARVLNEAFPEK
jgi:hypothetical protein